MYVCICSAVTDQQIRAAVAEGAHTLPLLTMALGVAANCGCCRELAQQVIAQARDDRTTIREVRQLALDA